MSLLLHFRGATLTLESYLKTKSPRAMPHNVRLDTEQGLRTECNTYMYCSVVKNVIGGVPMGEGDGAVNVEAYHWDRKP